MKDVYLVGEDDVTKEILRRLVKDYCDSLSIKRTEPVRGGKLKSMVKQYNRLSASVPVILLEDLDTEDCAPSARKKLLGEEIQQEDFIINIAVDEAEAWLYADTEGFSSYLKVPQESFPLSKPMKMGGPRARLEVDTDQKTSRHLTTVLILQSADKDLKQRIISTDGRCKGREYNPAILPFIREKWSPEVARLSSYSLDTTIKRLIRLNEKYR